MSPEQDMSKQQEFVIRTLEERNIRFVRLWFTDVLGFLKSVAIAPAELENAFAEGIGLMALLSKDSLVLQSQICWQSQILQRFQSCHGAQKHQGLRECFVTSQCQMVHHHLQIHEMFYVAH